METKKIAVVTGANGFVGSHLVDELLLKNYEVRCLVRKSSNLQWLEGKDVKIYDCGLEDVNELKKVVQGVNFLYHVAGVVKSKKPQGYYDGNVTTTKNLLDAVKEVNPEIEKVIVVSSQTAGGPSLDGTPVKEDDIPNPLTNYGKSKLAQEELVKTYMDKLPITICRPPAIYGERDTEIYLVFKTYKAGLMTLIGFNKKKVSLVHVADLVNGLILAGESEKSNGETYYISSEEFYDWKQVGLVLESIFGKKAINLKLPHSLVYTVAAIAEFFSMFSKKAATFNIEKARDFVQNYWICDVQKARRDLGYTQQVSLEEGMKRTIDWYKDKNWL